MLYTPHSITQNSSIFKSLEKNISDFYAVGSKINDLNKYALDANNAKEYAEALSGLNFQQAELLLSTKGLTTAQQQAILSEFRLANATGTLTTAQLTEILTTESRSKADTEALLLNTELITAETAEATAIHTVTAAKLAELVQTKALTQAEADLILTKMNVAKTSQQESVSLLNLLGTKLKNFGATAKNVGATLLTFAKIHPIIAAIGGAFTIGTIAVTAYKAAQKKALEEAQEAVSDLTDEITALNSEFKNTEQTVTDIGERFAELSQGVNKLTGKNLTLNTDDYAEFLELGNQLAEIFPTLPRVYDENGNAIIQLSGNVDTIVGSLQNLVEVQRDLANQEIAAKLPDLYDSAKTLANDYVKSIQDLEYQKEHYETLLSDLSTLTDWEDLYDEDGFTKDKYSKLAEYVSGVDFDEIRDTFGTEIGDAVAYYKKQLQEVNSELSPLLSSQANNWSNFTNSLFSWLYTDANYKVMSDEMQAGIQTVINEFDWDELDFKNFDEASSYIYQNLLNPISENQEVRDLFSQLFSSSIDNLDKVEIAEQLQNLLDRLGFKIDITPIFESEKALKETLQNSIRSISEEYVTGTAGTSLWVGYSEEDLSTLEKYTQDFNEEQISTWLAVTSGAETAKEAIEAYEAAIAATKSSSVLTITEDQAEALDEYQSKIDSIGSSLADLGNLTSSDITGLMADFREYAYIFEEFGVTGEEGVGNLGGALEALAEKMREIALDACPEMANAINAMFNEIINYPKGNPAELREEFDDLVEIYDKVTSGQTMNLDEATKLINKYPDLADAVEKVGDAYSFEEESIISLVNSKIEALNEATSYEHQATQKMLEDVKARLALYGEEARMILIRKKALIGSTDDPHLLIEHDDDEYNALLAERERLEALLEELEDNFETTIDWEKLTSDSKPEVFDWIETAIERLQSKLDSLADKVSDTYLTWGERSAALTTQIAETGNMIELQNKAAEAYLNKANDIGLPQNYIDKIQNGTLSIESIEDEDLIDDIQEYIEYYEKYLDALEAAKQGERELTELRIQNFEDIQTQYDSILADFENQAAIIETGLAKAEAQGQIATQNFYEKLHKNEELNLKALKEQKADLEAALLATGLTSGGEFENLQDQIDEVTLAIKESENALIEFQNQIRDTNWEVFDFNREQAQTVMSEADFLIDLLESQKLIDDIGDFTEAGLSSVGLHGVNYNGYLEEAIRYADELAEIQEELTKSENANNTELINRRNELLEKQREMILASEQEKSAITDLVIEGFEVQKSALQELIEEYEDALNAEKDLYDQQKKTADQTKKIAQIQKQLAAYTGDTSLEARAKVQQLKVQLEEAQSDLESDQYDQFISDQKDILNSIYDQYESVLDTMAEDTEALFQKAMTQAQQNSSTVNNTIEKQTEKVGYEITTGINDFWTDSKNTLNTNYDGIKQRIESNGISITDGVEQIVSQVEAADITVEAQEVASNTEQIKTNTDGLTGTISGLGTTIGGKIDDAKEAIVSALGKTSNSSTSAGISINTGSGNLASVVGTTFSGASGRWYEASDGGKSGSVTLLGAETWVLDKIEDGAEYPYHIIGYKDGEFAGSGWVKKLPEYASGLKKANKDHLAWTQDGGLEAIVRPSDGAILTPLKVGDSVLTSEATQNLISMMTDPSGFIAQNAQFSMPDLSAINTAGNNVENNIAITIPLENVTDVQSFLVEFQRNPKVQAIIQDMMASSMTGSSSLAKYRHKF